MFSVVQTHLPLSFTAMPLVCSSLYQESLSILNSLRDLCQDWNRTSSPLKSIPPASQTVIMVFTFPFPTALDMSLWHCFLRCAMIIHGHFFLLLWFISTVSYPSLRLQGQEHSDILYVSNERTDEWVTKRMGVRISPATFCLTVTWIPGTVIWFSTC